MNKGFYAKLASNSIRKNKKIYYPYILSGSLMVMVFYIFSFLSRSEVVASLPGREVLPVLFDFGSKMIAVFSIPFLFYTNAALIKKRKKELGLYNILGMNKKNISYLMFFETFMIYIFVIFFGLLSGIIFSKMAELCLVNIMDRKVNYRLYIDFNSVFSSLIVFAFIYILILLNSVRQIIKNDPIELLSSEQTGEREPKSRRLIAGLSLVILLISYIMISKIKMPIKPLNAGISIILMMVGTFGIFISLSVYILNILKENKEFYYRTSNFISISTMRYRMKRNAVSLAIITILVTFILSSLAFSLSFYTGSIETINNHYPYDIGFSVVIPTEKISDEMKTGEFTKNLNENVQKIISGYKDVKNIKTYSANMLSVIDNDVLDFGYSMKKTWFVPGYYDGWERENKKIVYTRIISQKDYEDISGENINLKKDQVIIASKDMDYSSDFIKDFEGKKYQIKEKTKNIPAMTEVRIDGASLDSHGCDEVFVIVKDLLSFLKGEVGAKYYNKENYMVFNYEDDINTGFSDEKNAEIYKNIYKNSGANEENSYLKSEKAEKFYALSGGLLFLAVIMNVLFISVTAVIMYYKQISEGFEDQKRFISMKKLGITQRQIKNSINSQMKSVFLLPVAVAGIHYIFCSNLIYIMLKYAVVDNKILVVKVMAISYLIFVIAYSIVYKLTSKAYFDIVNKEVEE